MRKEITTNCIFENGNKYHKHHKIQEISLTLNSMTYLYNNFPPEILVVSLMASALVEIQSEVNLTRRKNFYLSIHLSSIYLSIYVSFIYLSIHLSSNCPYMYLIYLSIMDLLQGFDLAHWGSWLNMLYMTVVFASAAGA